MSTLAHTSLGGVLQVIDEDRECKIYSNDVHGCTGYSASFAKLKGTDCSGMFIKSRITIHYSARLSDNYILDLTMKVQNSLIDLSYIDVAACGQVNGKNAAWIMVNKTGEVTFFNQNGDKAKCKLDNGLNTGSSCSTSDFKSLTDSIVSLSSSPATSKASSLASPISSASAAESSSESLATATGSSESSCSN